MFVSLHKIIMGAGKTATAIEPGTTFTPADADLQFLKDSKSIRPATDAEVALYEKQNPPKKAKAAAPASTAKTDASKTDTTAPAAAAPAAPAAAAKGTTAADPLA